MGKGLRKMLCGQHLAYIALAGLVLCLGLFVLRQGFASGTLAIFEAPTPSPTLLTPTATATATPSLTPEPTHTPTSTPSPSLTPSPTETPSATATDTPLPSPTPTHTATPLPSPTPTPTPAPTPDGTVRSVRVPILMYHYISQPPPNSGAVRVDLSVSPERFEEHLLYLRSAGYTGVTLYDLALALQTGHSLPPKPVIITLDDGYRDAYTHALPLLRKYGFTATVFLVTSLMDQGHPEYLTWEQVAEMSKAGMDMEAHGYTHDDLRQRSTDYLVWQILGSKEAIEARTKKSVRFFCYPAGKYDALVAKVLRSAHFWGAVTVEAGVDHCSQRPFELARVRVRGRFRGADLGATLAAYMAADKEGQACITMR